MCEYCGCQNFPAIAALTDEHDRLRGLGRDAVRLARDGNWDGTREVVRRLLGELAPHTAIEERGLFPAMATEFEDHVESLQDDHRRIEGTLEELVTASASPDQWQHHVESAVADLFEHILREQDGLFPASVSVLTAEQWDHLDAVRLEIAATADPRERTG